MTDTAFEKHFSVGQLATQWGYGRETIRKLIQHEPGVVKLRMGRKKTNTHYSVPQSVAERIHTRLMSV
jgi:hypothetical protein